MRHQGRKRPFFYFFCKGDITMDFRDKALTEQDIFEFKRKNLEHFFG